MDEADIRRAQAGDPEAFAELVRRYQGPVYGLAWRLTGDAEDARDLAQEAFLKIYRALPGYRFEAPLRTWILRIVANHCLDWLRRRPTPPLPLDAARDIPADGAADAEAEARSAADAVRRAVRELPAHYQIIVILHYTHGLRYREIASVLGIPVRTVETRLARARALLRRRLETTHPSVEAPGTELRTAPESTKLRGRTAPVPRR